MINDASVVIGGGNWGIKEADVLGYKLINNEFYARDIDFANSTAAGTYTDSTGVVRKSPYNLVQQSETFDNVAWTKSNYTATANQTSAPNGTLTADLISETTYTGTIPSILQPSVFNANGSNTFSIYIKPNNNARYFALSFGSTQRVRTTFDFQTKTFLTANYTGSVSNAVFSYQEVENGFTRIIVTADFPVFAASQSIEFGFLATNTYLFFATQNSDNRSFYVWGAQLVEGTEALPYFPTTTRLNVPRIDYRNADGSLSTTGRLLLEPQRTNSIRNSSMVGAANGTPGTLPTNWGAATAGLTQTVVGLGVESGLQYVDLRFNGTASTSIVRITPEAATQIASANGQTWASSAYMRRISGTYESSSIGFALRNSFGTGLGALTAANSLTTTLQRFVFVGTTNNASVAFVQPQIDFLVTIGQTYDFTIRVAAPQMELGAYATTWIPTTTAAVTRNADVASRTGVSSWIGQTQGTLFTDVEFTQVGTEVYILSLGSAGSDTISIRRLTSGEIRCALTAATSSGTTNASSAVLPNGRYKLAYKYSSGSIKLFINGSLSFSLNPTFTFGSALSSLFLGMTTASLGQLSDRIRQSILFPTSLTDEQCIQLTTL